MIEGKKGVGKRGQVTVFIIIAIAIVGIALAAYYFFPGIRTTGGSVDQNPEAFIEQCLEQDLRETVETISLQGGDLDPDHSYLYQGEEISYLCYTSENGKFCSIQQPLLKQHVESEIEEGIREEVDFCFTQLEQNYLDRGYNVELKEGRYSVELFPEKIETNFDYIFTITKGESERYDSFDVVLDNNNLYELLGIVNSIISLEAVYGEAETTSYMTYYKDLLVEKKEQIDGTKIYILTNTDTGNKFQFATRSRVLGPGLI